MIRALRVLLAPAVGLVFAVVIIQFYGYQALPTIGVGLQYALGDPASIARTLAWGLPLALATVGVTVAFKTGMFTIGAEGQVYIGALSGAVVGAYLPAVFPAADQIVPLLAAAAVGALVSAGLGWLKAYWGVDEVLSSLLSNYILLLLCGFLANGIFKDPAAQSPGATVPVKESALFADILPRTQLTWVIVIAALVIAVTWWIVERSTIGYRWKMVGTAPGFARAVGIDVARARVRSMALSGALCGLAGGVLVVAGHGRYSTEIAIGLGWVALMLALISRSKPGLALIWVIVYSIMQSAGRKIEQIAGVPTEMSLIIICVILITASSTAGLIGAATIVAARLRRKVVTR
ncbi:ABC transporter permease [Herbiconiux liukaitaii]|uniref:ABC transporter permease n=1 Tax=Herbiconiux liukaitaii TaxID=3342799 RepID=UPI0035B760CA